MSKFAFIAFLLLAAAPTFAAERKQAWIFSYGGETTAHIQNLDIDWIDEVKKDLSGDYLYIQRGNRAHVIRDAAVLAQLADLYQPNSGLRREQDELRKLLRPLERRERQIDREENRLDRLADSLDDDESAEAAGRVREVRQRTRELDQKRRELQSEMRVLEERERELDRRQDDFERRVDAQAERIIDEALRRGLGK